MNRQTTFNIVALHLLTQQRRSADSPELLGSLCRYRTPNGQSCAIGALIPDELYSPDMEAHNVYDLLNDHPSLGRALGVEDAEDMLLLEDLQELHDRSFPHDWPYQLRTLAKDHNLDDKIVHDYLKNEEMPSP